MLTDLLTERARLVSRVDALETEYLSPLRRAEIGADLWPSYAASNREAVKLLRQDIRAINNRIKVIRAKQRKERERAIAKRRHELESHSNPALPLLEDAFQLLRKLRDELDLSTDEHATIDTIGVYLKERSGLTATGRQAT